jgi:Family of unknown function (DUF6262)
MTSTAAPQARPAATMTKGRQADSARRRQRVTTALDQAAAAGTEISVSGIARTAGVDRTFLYRHRDLLEKIHALQAAPPAGAGPGVTRASLQADLLAAHERALRLTARTRQLEKRLSEALGEQTWRPIRARRTRRHRRPEPENHPPRTASRRPAPPARRTRPGPRRRPRRQPRAHDPAQPRRHDTPAMNLHHICHVR